MKLINEHRRVILALVVSTLIVFSIGILPRIVGGHGILAGLNLSDGYGYGGAPFVPPPETIVPPKVLPPVQPGQPPRTLPPISSIRTIVYTPGEETQVQLPPDGGNGSLNLPGSFFDVFIQVVVSVVPRSAAPPLPANVSIQRTISVDVFDSDGINTKIASGIPAVLTIEPTAQELALVGGDRTKLAIMRYLEDQGRWLELPTTVDINGNLRVTLFTFSLFGVAVKVNAGDVNADGVVDLLDLARMGAAFNTKTGDAQFNAQADLNLDGKVDLLDLAILGSSFGFKVGR